MRALAHLETRLKNLLTWEKVEKSAPGPLPEAQWLSTLFGHLFGFCKRPARSSQAAAPSPSCDDGPSLLARPLSRVGQGHFRRGPGAPVS